MNKLNKHIFLIGFMGTGKTAVSKEMSRRTGVDVLDTDLMIEDKEGMTIAEIFESKGEEFFRDAETKVLREISGRESCIVSCGGGIPLRKENQSIMRSCGLVVLLTAEPETVLHRVKNNSERPLLSGKTNIAHIESLMEKRKSSYEEAADFKIITDNKEVSQICRELTEILDWHKEDK